MKLNSSNNRRGFTLVEIMIVVAIIGLVTAIAVPTIGRSTEAVRVRADVATFSAMLRHARERDDDHNLAFVFKNVDRRLPHGAIARRCRQPEKLPVHAVGLVQQFTGLSPHPARRVTR